MNCPQCGYSFDREEEDAAFERALAAIRRKRTKRAGDAIRGKELHVNVPVIVSVVMSPRTIQPLPIDPDRPH